MDIRPGLLEKYELQERLGRGGMAEVWKAFDPRLQRYVAIKFLHAALRNDPAFLTRFVREARAVASLRHPNIVQIYDFETSPEEFEDIPAYMVMDYIEGPTLADYLHNTSSAYEFPSPTEMVSLFLSISDAVDYAHQRGLLHRDIKPANILLDQHHTSRNPMGEPMLTDFGIVKILGTVSDTLTSSTVGTPAYISPEQARGDPVTSASDIYALGVILYEMCTGLRPFRADTPLAVLLQHVSTPPLSPDTINPALSPALTEVILRGLAKEPADRFPTAIALTTALAEALDQPLPDRKRQPISSPDIRTLSHSSQELQDTPRDLQITPVLNDPVLSNEEPALLPPAMPPNFIYMPSSRVPAILGKVSEYATEAIPAAPTTRSPLEEQPQGPHPLIPTTPVPTGDEARPPQKSEEPPARPRKRRTMQIALIALLLVVVIGSGLTALFVSRAGPASTNIVGHTFFTSSGAAPGTNNLGVNDTFQIHLTNIPLPQAKNSYYAWLLPDQNQSEANPRALGALVITNGTATLPSPYIDPQHTNLLASFSRFLVTEEPESPLPQNPSLDKSAWRYYAEIPQNPPVKDCIAVINQLNALCHLRHLLSGDPELAQINLPGGLNYWFLHNTQKLRQWTAEIMNSNNPLAIRHKVVNLLYLLDGTGCIAQDLQASALGRENTPDDNTLTKLAAIPLLDCSLTPNVTGYLAHIHNHLNAMVLSPGALKEQVTLAATISTELNTINAQLKQVQQTARQLIALDDPHLLLSEGQHLRTEIDTLANNILKGGTDPHTNTAEQGVISITNQIQQLTTMDVIQY